MKKMILIVTALLLLCGCVSSAVASSAYTGALPASSAISTPQDVSAQEPGVAGDWSKVTTEAVNPSVTVGTEKLVIRWTNDSEGELAFGAAFHLERLNGDEWEYVPYKNDGEAVFIAIAWILPAKDSLEHSYDLTRYDADELTPGTYRWVDGFHNEEASNSHRFTAQFTITQ
ncbi:MAG: hypothetical protein IJC25_06730 [Clostridia bacterium]|nr:hypothetical protein [Clostridia bacterium]